MVKPVGLHYIGVGDVEVGFKRDMLGEPYLPAYLSYRGSGNLLDIEGDRGREFQCDLVDGNIVAGKDFRYDTVNPTFGAGDFGNRIPVVESCEKRANGLKVVLRALDYSPLWVESGTYRERMIKGRYPLCGWKMEVNYTVSARSLRMDVVAWHEDSMAHKVHQFRPAILYLNADYFQYPLENERLRDKDSWLSARIGSSEVKVKSKGAESDIGEVLLTFKGGINGSLTGSVLTQRQFKESVPGELVEDGTADVWEAMVHREYNSWFNKGYRFRGWGQIDLQPAKMVADLPTLIRNLLEAVNERRNRMNIICTDGFKIVTAAEYEWLDSEGRLVDMSSHPAPSGTAYYSGTVAGLNNVLADMPDDWENPVVEPPVEPPVDPPWNQDFEDLVLAKLDHIIDLLEMT